MNTESSSAIAWLGEIPLHWNQKRLKHLAHIDNSGAWGDEPEECDSPLRVATTAQISPEGKLHVEAMPLRCFETKEADYFACKAGDIVIVKSSGSATNIITGKAALIGLEEEGIVFSNFLMRLRPHRELVNPRFLFRFLTSGIIRARIELMVSTTTYPNLDVGEYTTFEIPLPDLPEQDRIADFLDRETSRIDALIAAKERLLELLAEKRRALITHAVTKGLNPNAPMRDSGLPWLGEIPRHWEIERAKWLFRERDERTESEEGELLTVSHITGVTPRSEKEVFMFEAETTEGYKICRANDLVINTMWAWMGAMGVSRVDGIVSPSYNVYTANARLIPSYVDMIVRTPLFATEVIRFSKGVWSSRLRLYPEGFFDIWFPVPSREEQEAIVGHVKERTTRYDDLARSAEASIELLQELRSALIAAAVTGKIDVGSRQKVFESA